MIRPNFQSVISMTTIVLFLAAIAIWIANGGIGRIREAGGSHAGGAGAYTETWTADSMFGLMACNQGSAGADYGSGVLVAAEAPRLSSSFITSRPTEFNQRNTFTTYGLDNVAINDGRSFNCRMVSSQQFPTVTKWSVTGHINP